MQSIDFSALGSDRQFVFPSSFDLKRPSVGIFDLAQVLFPSVGPTHHYRTGVISVGFGPY